MPPVLSEKIAVVPDGAAGSFEVSDAGDCNKYIVISARTLLAAFKHFPDDFKQGIRIPESGNF